MLAKQAESYYQWARLSRRSIAALLALFAHPLFGGVVLDGSFGTHGALPGPNFMITAPMGKQIGGNLFQSFSQFNLTKTQSATFCGPATVQNILARVTSGSPSSIDGKIKVDPMMADANLFLMNPAGVLFGKNARLEVGGSFAVTTANYLRLVGGGRFNANLGGDNMLTSAPVSAFGFLSSAPTQVSLTGSSFNLEPRKVFSSVGGDITMRGAQITGPGSRVNLISVKSPGEVQFDATSLNSAVDLHQFTAMGAVNLASSTIDTSGPGRVPHLNQPGNGPIVIRGGNLILQNSSISALTHDSGNGGDVSLTAESLLSLQDTRIYTDTDGSGNGGNVTLTAKSLIIDSTSKEQGTVIQANTYGSGNGGGIALNADSLLIQGPSRIVSNTVRLTPDEVSRIGNAGNIVLNAGSFVMHGKSVSLQPIIESIALGTTGDGNGGDVTGAAKSILIGPFAAIVAQTLGAGEAGNIFVDTGTLELKPNGFISTSTFGSSGGGNITIGADSVLVDGTGELKGPTGNFFTGIFSQAEGALQNPGKGGDITITAADLVLQNSGVISAQSFVSSVAGSVHLKLETLSLDTGSLISSANTGSGDAGRIVIDTTGPLKLKRESSISTSSDLSDAGSIDITSGGAVRLKYQSSITVSAGHNGGDIRVTAPDLVYLLDSSITATAGTSGARGAGGNIRIDPQFIVLQNSFISANAAIGQGGNIDLVSDFLFNSDLSNSNITATGTTNGTVNITAPALDLGAQLITLPSSLLSAENQLQERCTALWRGDFSSFISIGRGGTEPAPDELQNTF